MAHSVSPTFITMSMIKKDFRMTTWAASTMGTILSLSLYSIRTKSLVRKLGEAMIRICSPKLWRLKKTWNLKRCSIRRRASMLKTWSFGKKARCRKRCSRALFKHRSQRLTQKSRTNVASSLQSCMRRSNFWGSQRRTMKTWTLHRFPLT